MYEIQHNLQTRSAFVDRLSKFTKVNVIIIHQQVVFSSGENLTLGVYVAFVVFCEGAHV